MEGNLKQQQTSAKSTISRENYIIFLTVTLVYTGFSAGYLFISLFLIQIKHALLINVGLIYLVTGAIDIVVQVIGGSLSDILGTRTVTVAGLSGSAILYALLSMFVFQNSPVIFYFVVFPLLGLFSGLFQLAISSYISDRKKEQMASGMSLLYVGLNLGFTAGPVTGGLLVQYYGYSSLFIFGTVTVLASIVVAVLGLKSNPKYALRVGVEKHEKTTLRKLEKGVLPLLSMVFVSWFVIAFQAVPLSVFESKFLTLTSVEIGIVLSTNGLLITLFQSYISKLISIEKKARLYSVAVGSVIMAVGFIVVAAVRTFIPLEIAITLTTLGEMMIAVPTQVVITLFSKEYNRGQYQGYYFAFSRAGSSVSAYAGLVIFAVFVTHAVVGWYIVIGVSFAAGLFYTLLSPTIERNFRSVSMEEEIKLQ